MFQNVTSEPGTEGKLFLNGCPAYCCVKTVWIWIRRIGKIAKRSDVGFIGRLSNFILCFEEKHQYESRSRAGKSTFSYIQEKGMEMAREGIDVEMIQHLCYGSVSVEKNYKNQGG